MRKHLAALAAATAIVAGGTGAALARTVVYVGNAASNTVTVMDFDPATGDLAEIQTVALPNQPGGTTPLAISPDKRFLFVGLRSEPFSVATFAIDPASGQLTHVGDGPLDNSMAAIATDRTGRFLLAASYPDHRITVSPIGEDGLVGASRQAIEDIPNAHAIRADAANRFVLVPSLGSDSVRIFAFDESTGTLTPTTPDRVQVGERDGPRHFVFDSKDEHVYLLSEISARLQVFDYDKATGRLTQIQQADFSVPGYTPNNETWAASDIHITPDDRFVYAAVRATSTLAAFAIDPATGQVTPAGVFPTETFPRGFAIDPTGRYLLAAGQLSGHVMSYAIDQDTGELTILKRYRVGDAPNWIEFVTLP